MSTLYCAVCKKAADQKCSCGTLYCSKTCQSEDWYAGHNAEHENRATEPTEASLISIIFLGNSSASAVRFIDAKKLKTHSDAPIDFRDVYKPDPSERPIENAADNLAFSFMHRILEMKFGNKQRYSFKKIGEYALLNAMHQAIHELAYYWAKHWSLRRTEIVRLAFLMENGFESLLALRVKNRQQRKFSRWELFLAAINSDVLDKDGATGDTTNILTNLRQQLLFKDSVPDDARLAEVRRTFVTLDFTSDVFLRKLVTQMQNFDVDRLKLLRIQEHWKGLISSMALALAWMYAKDFEDVDASDMISPSAVRIRLAAATALLQIKAKEFALEVNRPSFKDVGKQMNELDSDDAEL